LKYVVYLCAFFWAVPFFIASLRRILDILRGPDGETPLQHEQYRQTVRNAVRDLIIFNLLLFLAFAAVVYASLRL
jgi:hypothetical protein